MKVLSLFSGIGAFEKALDNLKIQYELVGYCEIDKYASKSYSAIHNVPESMNLGDITKIDEKALPKDIDLITYGFPCQDISLAGKQKGLFNEDGTQTRSGLFFDALRIIKETQPRVAIAENVKNLVGKKFEKQFQIVLDSLEEAGYNNKWCVLNAKDFGIPQNRERVFIISIRKDIDTGMFQFPDGFPLELRLKDMLEDVVDEKYYLSDTVQERFQLTDETFTKNVVGTTKPDFRTIGQRDWVYQDNSIIGSLVATDYKQPKQLLVSEPRIDVIGNYSPSGHDASRIVDENGIAPTVKENHGTVTAVAMRGRYNEDGQVEQNIEVSNREYANAITTVQKDSLIAEQGTIDVIKEYNQNARHQQDLLQCATGICRTIPAGTHGSTPHLLKTVVNHNPLRIRKLTPKECFRLMGFDDVDFEKAEKVNSNTQLYKQAGNSIVVDVLKYLIKALTDCGALATRKEQKEMELRVNDYQLPSPITFNYEEIKKELIEKVSMYETLVYTDEQIKDAKNDRANLNKLKKALNDERIRLEKEYMQPFNDTKAKFNEIIALIDKPVLVIDSQVKAYEEKQKEEKLQKINEYMMEIEKHLPDDVHIPIDCKWLNASVSMKSVQAEIDAKLEQIQNDIITLQNLPEFGFEATEVYKTTLDINRALNEGKKLSEIAKKKAEAEAEAKKQEEQIEGQVEFTDTKTFEENVVKPTQEVPSKQWVAFKCLLSVEDAQALGQFFKSRNIAYEQI